MNTASIIICIVLGVLVGFALTKLILDKKKKKGGCSGNCSGCNSCNKGNKQGNP